MLLLSCQKLLLLSCSGGSSRGGTGCLGLYSISDLLLLLLLLLLVLLGLLSVVKGSADSLPGSTDRLLCLLLLLLVLKMYSGRSRLSPRSGRPLQESLATCSGSLGSYEKLLRSCTWCAGKLELGSGITSSCYSSLRTRMHGDGGTVRTGRHGQSYHGRRRHELTTANKHLLLGWL